MGAMEAFWECAAQCNAQTKAWFSPSPDPNLTLTLPLPLTLTLTLILPLTKAWIANGWARESLLLFASGWEFMNMNRVVELGSQDRA